MSKGEPTAEGRAEVAKVVNARMKQLKLTPPDLIALTRLAENTVRDVINETGNPSRATLVVIAVKLGFNPPDYLDNLIRGKPTESVTTSSPLEVQLASLASGLAEVGALRMDVAGLTDVIQEMDRKIDVLIGRQNPPDEDSSSD